MSNEKDIGSGLMTPFTVLDYVKFRLRNRHPWLVFTALLIASWSTYQPIGDSLLSLNIGIAITVAYFTDSILAILEDKLVITDDKGASLWRSLLFSILKIAPIFIFVGVYIGSSAVTISLPSLIGSTLNRTGVKHVDRDLLPIVCLLFILAFACAIFANVLTAYATRFSQPGKTFDEIYLRRGAMNLSDKAWLYFTIAGAFLPPMLSIGAWQPNLVAAVLVPILISDVRHRVGQVSESDYYRARRNSKNLSPVSLFISGSAWSTFPFLALAAIVFIAVGTYGFLKGDYSLTFFGFLSALFMACLGDYVAQFMSLKRPDKKAALFAELSKGPGYGFVDYSSKASRGMGLSIARSGKYISLYSAEALDISVTPSDILAVVEDLVRCAGGDPMNPTEIFLHPASTGGKWKLPSC